MDNSGFIFFNSAKKSTLSYGLLGANLRSAESNALECLWDSRRDTPGAAPDRWGEAKSAIYKCARCVADIPLSYGLLDVHLDPHRVKPLECLWDSRRETPGQHQIGGCEVCYLQVCTMRCRYTAVVRAAGRSSGSAQSQHARMSLGLTPRRRCLHPGSLHQVVTPPPIRQPSIVMATSVSLSVCVLLCFIVIIRP